MCLVSLEGLPNFLPNQKSRFAERSPSRHREDWSHCHDSCYGSCEVPGPTKKTPRTVAIILLKIPTTMCLGWELAGRTVNGPPCWHRQSGVNLGSKSVMKLDNSCASRSNLPIPRLI